MDGGRVLFDASAYILFEACGDSEIDCFHRTIAGAFELESDAGTADDDAQSCSGDHQFDPVAVDGDFHFCGPDFLDHQVDEEVSPADRDEEDGVVDQFCTTRPVHEDTAAEKSNGCEDWTMSEQERGRLFWENCLAS